MFLLKTLNAFRRSFELNEDLTSLGMLNRQNGLIIGCMLRERNELLDLADINLNYIRCTEGTNFKLDEAFRMEGGKYVDDRHFDMNALQTEMTAFHILFKVHKVLSVELHRRDTSKFVTQCPTCTNGYLMKTEMQSFIDSIRECLLLNNVSCIDNEDLCRFEELTPYCFTFMDTQIGDRNFINGFTTQVDISRLSSDSDLVPCTLRTANFWPYQGASSCVRRLSTDVKICPQRKLRGVTNKLLNKCLTEHRVELINSFTDAYDTLNQCGKWKCLDDHLSLEC